MTDARPALRLSTEAGEMDVDAIHAYLGGESYWARGIPRETVARAIRNSLCFGAFDGDAQVAFARVVTDRATYAYLGDVYVLEAYRGRGVGKWLMAAVDAHPELQGLRRWGLVTRDAHGLYARFGFTPIDRPERFMERTDPGIYTRGPRPAARPPV
jgi:GNAT superfamily N-acetyltransferase